MKKLCMILPLALVLCFMVDCEDRASLVELEKFQAQADVEEQNKALVKNNFEAWNKGDFEAFKETVAPEQVWYNPSRSTTPMSLEETIEFGKMQLNAFPDLTFSLEEMIAEGDKVIYMFIMRGTHEGEYQGIPATGNKIESSGIVISRIENGKIVEVREDGDMLGLFQQLGMELKPKEGEK